MAAFRSQRASSRAIDRDPSVADSHPFRWCRNPSSRRPLQLISISLPLLPLDHSSKAATMEPATAPQRRQRRPRPSQRGCSVGTAAAAAATSLVMMATAAGAAATSLVGIAGGGWASARSAASAAAFAAPPAPMSWRRRQQQQHYQQHWHRQSWACPPSCLPNLGARASSSSGRPMWTLAASAKPDSATDAAAGPGDASSPSSVLVAVRDKLLLGIEPSPDVAAILVVYFVQGAIGEARGSYAHSERLWGVRTLPHKPCNVTITTTTVSQIKAWRGWPPRST